ncbi:SxtJ family membrane protein [uncultured Ruegeria sp.]|uniref:SxtJ family membrane protein n=1 Tax=uncultured Ruegeria sp. TaxID=259304 RepID=UPI0026065DD4|nr:SxtJ family membrane protein [uncultured Ruegeria sp.]
MSDYNANVTVRMGSERNFGLIIGLVCMVIAFWPLLHGGALRTIWFGVAVLLAGLAVFAPKLLAVPNKIWFRFGMLLGAIVAPIVMLLVYVTTFLPIGLILKATGKDLMRLRRNPAAETYWITREDKPQSMSRQF